MKKTLLILFSLLLFLPEFYLIPQQFNEQTFTLPTSFEPDWDWAKSGNGTGTEWGLSVSVDRWGNSYFLGMFNSPTINFSGTVLTNSSSSFDIFLIKYDLYGNLLWAKTFGSSQDDFGNEVVADSLGNVFIGGSFSSNSISFGSYTLNNSAANNTSDVFLVKFNLHGDVVWAKSAGGNARDVLIGMDADSLGNCYLTGSYASANITFGTTTLTNTNTNEDIFVAKYDYNGNPIWAKSGNGAGMDWGNAVAVDGSGNCYVTGSFTGTSITFSGNALNNSNTDGSSDIFVVKYDSSGNVVWANKWGGSGDDVGLEIDVSRDGKCYLTGPYQSGSLAFGSTTLTNSSTSYEDIFIVKIDQTGNALWAKSGNGNRNDNVYDIALDNYQNVFLTGSFNSHIINFGDSTLTNTSVSDTADIFIVKFDADGNLVWTSRAGGNDLDIGSSIAVYNSESFFIGGTYRTNNLSFGSTSLPNSGSFDVFIAYSGNIVEKQKIYVTPPFHGAPAASGSAVFDISNVGNGNMNWAAISSDPSWLTITSGATGNSNFGQIQVNYKSNLGDCRIDSIIIVAPGAVNSPYIVEVRQSAYGSDWIIKTSGTTETLNDVKFISDQLGWVVGNNGLILHSTNSGSTWIEQTSPKNVNLLKIFFIDSLKGWAVGDSGTIIKTTDGGNLWELKNSGTTINLSCLQFLNEDIGWISGGQSVLRTTDGGNNWISSGSILIGSPITSLHFRDSYNGIIGGSRDMVNGYFALHKTTDGGASWIGLHEYGPGNIFTFADDLETGLLCVLFDGQSTFYKTTNGGEIWNYNTRFNMTDFLFTRSMHLNSYKQSWIILNNHKYFVYSSDFGSSWGSQYNGINGTELMAMTSFDSTLAWSVGKGGYILRYHKTDSSKYLKVINPNGGNKFRVGSIMSITWESGGMDQISLYVHEAPFPIVHNLTAANSAYLWEIPPFFSGSYRISIRSNSFDQLFDLSDNPFIILPSCFTWTLEDSTGKSASITVPKNVISVIGDNTLELSDFIGMFFHRNDSLICGGYGIWEDEDLIITAWGDNDQTPIKDGFSEGEEMVFKIFKPNSCEEYFAKVTLETGSPVYSTNANYTLTSLIGINGVRLTIEGFYNYNSTTDWLSMKDTVRAYLRNSTSPYYIVDSAKSILDTLGFVANFEFNNVTNGDYYLVIKHRNSIETWCSGPITISDGDFNCYSFVNDSSKAYGNNMKKKGYKWCVYSGDVNQDGMIDLTDMIEVDNDNASFVIGYIPSDVDGNLTSDLSDMIIVDNNNAAFVGKVVPPGAINSKKVELRKQHF